MTAPTHQAPNDYHARLDWQDGQPVSSTYGDVYFSRDDGLEESRHVFLRHNRLHERFAALAPDALFTIGETGFGTGLNFLLAWELFEERAPASARLAFVSTEKYPLHPDDLAQALAQWPALARYSTELLRQYDVLPPGWQRFVLAGGRVTLTLLVGDARQTLNELGARVDAWFLDGFSPAKNPEMWQDELFRAMAQASYPGTTFATFTSAGFVRRGLEAAGFAVEKVPGHGNKREMCCGQLEQPPTPQWRAPWLDLPAQPASDRTAIVVGAGIAGACAAASLARRGWRVTVFDRNLSPAREASGNPQGVLYTKLSAHFTPLTQLLLSAYPYALRTLGETLEQGENTWQHCGVLQLSHDEDEAKRHQALAQAGLPEGFLRAVDAAEASRIAGMTMPQGGLYFPQGGWLHPPALVEALLTDPNIDLRLGHTIIELAHNPDLSQWVAVDTQDHMAVAEVVILAGAHDTANFDATAHLPLKRIRGQVTVVPATADSRKLAAVVCGEGYIAPARLDTHCLGATFKFDTSDTSTNRFEHQENLDMLSRMAPELHQALGGDTLNEAALGGRAALRTTSPDYLPIVGPVADPQQLVHSYAALANDATLQLNTPAPWVEGLYVSTAHGSRGMVTAPLAGELLASMICGEPLPLPLPVAQALHPNRFVMRDLARKKITPQS